MYYLINRFINLKKDFYTEICLSINDNIKLKLIFNIYTSKVIVCIKTILKP